MKERLITLGLAACALLLFWMLFLPKPAAPPNAPPPLTTGADDEGYMGMFGWLAVTKVPSLVLHQRFDRLSDKAVSPRPTGNLLIVTLPFKVVVHPEEFQALDRWVDAGNTLLVLASLDDTPLWDAVSDNFLPDLTRITRMTFNAKGPASKTSTQGTAASSLLTPAGSEIELQPSGRIAVLHGVARLATLSRLPSTQWQAGAQTFAPVLELARRRDTAEPVMWLKSNGHGAIILSAYASLFSNNVIGKADNAQLLANITAWSLQPGGRIIIDDAHQGALDEYDAAKFYADPRLHRTLLWLVALWLAWVLGAQALRAAAPNRSGLDESATLRMTARFFAGVLRPVASAQWLLDEFFERLRRRHGLLHGARPPWEWLQAHAGVVGTDLEELRDLYERTQSGHRVSLVRLQRTISQISGKIS
ncbi:MAG TPA: DUF4350 domain-containing protein [Steroidobacteraceae bacterium]|nr:DUF4350 domain-containing protein [Steroidobacteraceae bacterium]